MSTNTPYRTRLDIEVDIEFEVYPPSGGKRDPGGMQIEPDLPSQVEITAVYLTTDTNQECNLVGVLPEATLIDIEDEIFEALEL